jgi:hypothetical protein
MDPPACQVGYGNAAVGVKTVWESDLVVNDQRYLRAVPARA